MEIETIPDNNNEDIFNKDAQDVDNNNKSFGDSSSYDISYSSTPGDNEATEIDDIPPKYVLLKQLDPQHPDRLYAKILRAKEIENVVHQWQNEFRMNKDHAICMLYQFYVDLSAYQHVNVKTFLVTEENDINELVPRMDRTVNKILSYTGKYFLFIRNKPHQKKIAKIEEFIETFVAMSAKEKIIYEYDLFIKLCQFFAHMSDSSKRPIKHTGVFLALKHQTGLIRLGTKILHKMSSVKKALESEENPELIEEMKTKIAKLKVYDGNVNKLVYFLHVSVYCKNCHYLDPKLHFMRQECISELYTWIEMFPGRYLHNEYLKFIMDAITDVNKCVRYTAIEVIAKIVENFEAIIHSKLAKIIIPISKQIKDIDYNVSILAVDTITMIRRYTKIPCDIREVLCKTIYSMHYPLAAACGRYLSEFIHQKNEENGDGDEEGLLKLFIAFELKAIKRGFVKMHPYIIEAMYDYFPVLQNVKVYIKFLEGNECDDELRTVWVNILTESMSQTITGKSSLKREKHRVGKVNAEQVENIIKELILSMKSMISYCSLEILSPLLLLIKENMQNNTMDIS